MIYFAYNSDCFIKEIYFHKKYRKKLICISKNIPERIKINVYSALLPNEQTFLSYQGSLAELYFVKMKYMSDNEYINYKNMIQLNYESSYLNDVLNNLDVNKIYEDLNNKIILLSNDYYKNDCHQQLVIKWFRDNNCEINKFVYKQMESRSLF